MPTPISLIGYNVSESLSVQFTSLSLNVENDTTYLWTFGDGTTSSEENPLKLYTEEGFYNVSLLVTNIDASDSTSSVLINLTGSPAPTLMTDIPAMVDLYSPTQVIGSVKNNKQKEFFIAKWQCYLQPLVVEPEVTVDNVYNANAYNPLANSLIARLTVIDIILAEASAFTISIANEGQQPSGTSSSNSSSTSSSNGGIKSIETGPTKVERYENKDTSSNSEKLSNLSKAYQQLIVKDGVLSELEKLACQEAERLQVYLPMCGHIKAPVKGFKVVKKTKPSGYNANPFGITDRMT
jgi:PKD repeat protein